MYTKSELIRLLGLMKIFQIFRFERRERAGMDFPGSL